MPEKPYVDYEITFAVDLEGNFIPESKPQGIALPDGINEPGELVFPIDRQQAINIAREAGLEPGLGLGRYFAHFTWFGGKSRGGNGTYAWAVDNTLAVSPQGQMIGFSIIIDANDGRVLAVSEWRAIY